VFGEFLFLLCVCVFGGGAARELRRPRSGRRCGYQHAVFLPLSLPRARHSPTPTTTPTPPAPGRARRPQVATLRSAVKLEQEQQFMIAKKLQELTGSKNIKIKPVIDTSLIAGFVVEYGSRQIDLSVRGQITKVGDELSTNMALKMA
jgi:hypothetical protein